MTGTNDQPMESCSPRAGSSPFLVSSLGVAMVIGGAIAGAALLLGRHVPELTGGTGRLVVFGGVLLGCLPLVFVLLMGVSSLTGRKVLPLSLALVGRINCAFLPGARLMARLFRLGPKGLEHSFLHMQNGLVRAWDERASHARLLVLLPHCLESGVKAKMDDILRHYDCTVRVVGGGSRARKEVAELQPDAILAVACERDLVSGMIEVSGKIPSILGVPNIQRHGPCKATDVNIDEFAEALAFLGTRTTREPIAD